MIIKQQFSRLIRSSPKSVMMSKSGFCDACGGYGPFQYVRIINEKLARQWDLSEKQCEGMSARESMYCVFCGCSYRLRLLARAINFWVEGNVEKSLLQTINSRKFNGLKIAEINSCGVLHDVLRCAKHLSYSEYRSTDPNIRNEDLLQLTYDSNNFDIVLNSDVLEHVPDIDRALREIWRVLKPGGVCIMTVPIIHGRVSRMRAHVKKDGTITHDRSESFHGSGEPDYLVWNELGDDFVDRLRRVGFEAYELFLNERNSSDMSGVFIALKQGDSKKIPVKDVIAADKFNVEWQVKRIEKLAEKQRLSQDHIHNIEEILRGYKSEREQLMGLLEQKSTNRLRAILRRRR